MQSSMLSQVSTSEVSQNTMFRCWINLTNVIFVTNLKNWYNFSENEGYFNVQSEMQDISLDTLQCRTNGQNAGLSHEKQDFWSCYLK